MKNNTVRVVKNSQKRFNVDYFLTYPLIFVILGIFLLPKLAFLSSITEENIINLTNKERVNLGIPALKTNDLLTKAAIAKGKSIIKSQTFQHNIGDKKFSSWIKDVNYKYIFVGENLALDFTSSEGAMRAWMNSPSHKKNLLNEKFKEIGVAIIEDNFQGKNTTIIVQIFGTQASPIINEQISETKTTAPTKERIIKNPVIRQNIKSEDAPQEKDLSSNPVKYQPKSPFDIIYNKQIAGIIVLNFITVLLIIIAYSIHRMSNLHKKSIKCTK